MDRQPPPPMADAQSEPQPMDVDPLPPPMAITSPEETEVAPLNPPMDGDAVVPAPPPVREETTTSQPSAPPPDWQQPPEEEGKQPPPPPPPSFSAVPTVNQPPPPPPPSQSEPPQETSSTAPPAEQQPVETTASMQPAQPPMGVSTDVAASPVEPTNKVITQADNGVAQAMPPGDPEAASQPQATPPPPTRPAEPPQQQQQPPVMQQQPPVVRQPTVMQQQQPVAQQPPVLQHQQPVVQQPPVMPHQPVIQQPPVMQQQPVVQQPRIMQQQQAIPMQQTAMPTNEMPNGPAAFHHAAPPAFARQQQPAAPPPASPADANGNNQQQQQGPLKELRVEDALMYLDHVKQEFKDRPHIYNEFLDIMKNFKTQTVDTPGVIDRVSRLFRGYNNLILGFNTFLPEGFRISIEDLKRQEAQQLAEEQAQMANTTMQSPGWSEDRGAAAPTSFQQQHAPKAPPPRAMAPSSSPSVPRNAVQAPPPQQPQQQPPQAHPAVEFDHAISYVTKIKRRFAGDPNIYHSFLEILHNYQREQRGIKEVLEQVAHLFQDHPDLLKEFTFFLPDAVQEQAKERLHRAAAESEMRLASKRQLHEYRMQPQQQKFIDMTARGQEGNKRVHEEEPATYTYNSAVERQFFDATKEALTAYTRDGGQAWAEFLKCLDMYAQDILSRNEMLNFVEPLLGKRHTKLFEEFKRILAAAGNPTGMTPPTEESWYSVPLAEIDFSRCRRCSPSYRALPRDYPSHPCSDRSPEEAKVLNDVWVSLPVGSEESYTFRHMRRNTYEETLFRVEDERFEIDMVIDSNAATLQRLLPVAEEIGMLAAEDVPLTDTAKPAGEIVGLGGRRFQYTFDKSILGVIHRNVITRIYGDNGPEMLELMVKNPTVAIPLVVQRLRQKDSEFRAARERLNRHWRELAEQNYYKSLDHRGLTWRTIDKRATSTRTMIVEIKDRAENGGKESSEALRLKLEKAKEEHGTFYEVTKGHTLSETLDLTFLPKPDRRIFTPHVSLMYENASWAQCDAYRILAFALERGPISPGDKERCHRLWVEFLGPWFNMSQNWMEKPAVTYQEARERSPEKMSSLEPSVVSEDDEDSMEDDMDRRGRMVTEELPRDSSKGKQEFSDHHPLPPECVVSTLYGEGRIVEFRRSDHVYVVDFPFGRGYLRPSTVLCSNLPVEQSGYTQKLREHDRTKLARPLDQLAYGTQSLYLFFRLHHILIQRLNTAKRLAYSVDDDRSMVTMIEQMPHTNRNAVGRSRYEAYLSLLYALLDGEGSKYEDRVRSLLGHGAYELATMDKLISHIWKNLQAIASDETMWSLIQLYRRHVAAGSFQPEAFRSEAAFLADGEVMYAFQHCFLGNKDASVIYMEYAGVMEEDDGMPQAVPEEMEEQPPASKKQKR